MGRRLSIKIDGNDILMVEGKYKNNTFFAENHCKIKTPDGAVLGGEIMDIMSLQTVIAEQLKKNKFKSRNVTVLIDSNQTISRVVNLPYVAKKSDVISMVKYELDQILPIDISEYTFVYSVLSKYHEEEVEKADYYVNGISTIILDKYKELMKNIGLSIESMNFSYINLESVPKNSKEYKTLNHGEEVIGFIDFGFDNTVLTTLNCGKHDFSRIIDNGCQKIINETTGFFDKSVAEIEFMMKNMYMREDENQKESNLVSMLRSRFEDLAIEINRYIKYYKTNSKGVPFGRLYIYGAGLLPKDMLEYLAELTGIETERIDRLSYLNDDKVDNFNISVYFDLVMALTIPSSKLNLLSMEEAASKKRTNKILITSAVVIPLVIVLGFIGWTQMQKINKIHDEISEMEAFMDEPTNIKLMAEINELNIEKAEKELAITNLEVADLYMYIHDIVGTKYFENIAIATPVDTYVTQITVNMIENQGLVLYLQCTSDSLTSISQYEKNLLNLGYYDTVETTSISNAKEYTYVLMCKVKGGNIDEN